MGAIQSFSGRRRNFEKPPEMVICLGWHFQLATTCSSVRRIVSHSAGQPGQHSEHAATHRHDQQVLHCYHLSAVRSGASAGVDGSSRQGPVPLSATALVRPPGPPPGLSTRPLPSLPPLSNAPSPEYRQHHDVEAPRVDTATCFRPGWRVHSRLASLAESGRIERDQLDAAVTWGSGPNAPPGRGPRPGGSEWTAVRRILAPPTGSSTRRPGCARAPRPWAGSHRPAARLRGE